VDIVAKMVFALQVQCQHLVSAYLGWVEWRRVIWAENLEWKAQTERIAERERLEEEQRAT
jgi:hypothetical protein